MDFLKCQEIMNFAFNEEKHWVKLVVPVTFWNFGSVSLEHVSLWIKNHEDSCLLSFPNLPLPKLGRIMSVSLTKDEEGAGNSHAISDELVVPILRSETKGRFKSDLSRKSRKE